VVVSWFEHVFLRAEVENVYNWWYNE